MNEMGGLSTSTIKALQQVFAEEASVQHVWLYGSRAKGSQHPGSDIDLALEGTAVSHQVRLQLMAAIEELLLPYTVDLTVWHDLPSEVQEHLQRVGICFYSRSAEARSCR